MTIALEGEFDTYITLCPDGTAIVYRVAEPRLVDALGSYAERVGDKVVDHTERGGLLGRVLP